MKLLFDQNLSPKLVHKLNDLFEGSNHVAFLDRGSAPDTDIWNLAKSQGFTLVSKDGDFAHLLAAKGFPPKIVLIQLGNCRTDAVEAALRAHQDAIHTLETRRDIGLLTLQAEVRKP